MKVGYQGVPGAYSEVATINFFGKDGYESIGYDNFRSLIKDLSNSSCAFNSLIDSNLRSSRNRLRNRITSVSPYISFSKSIIWT